MAIRFGALGIDLVVHCNDNRDGAEAVTAAIRAADGKARLLHANVADSEAAASVVDDAASQLGGLDILINNAGSMFGRTAIADAMMSSMKVLSRSISVASSLLRARPHR